MTRASATPRSSRLYACGMNCPEVEPPSMIPAERRFDPVRSVTACSCTPTGLFVNALALYPIEERTCACAPSGATPSWRDTIFTTPLIASLPYNAAPWGPRITSTRSEERRVGKETWDTVTEQQYMELLLR